MILVFTLCAVGGGAILLLLLLLSLFGWDSGHESAFDVIHSAIPLDGVHLGDADAAHASVGHGYQESSQAFNIISFRSVVAAITFFGLGGNIAAAGNLPLFFVFVCAVAAGMTAMLVVAWLMQLLLSLQDEGTVQLQNVVGLPATCYLAIPGQQQGAGKVTVTVQHRSMELEAITRGPAIPTGHDVEIVALVTPSTVEVKAQE